MSKNYTIAESFEIPSKGKVYDVKFDPHITLRSMTIADEQRRLQPVKDGRNYKVLCDMLDDCIVSPKLPKGFSTYDMSIADYEFLLTKLRIITYGSDYRVSALCPHCGARIDHVNTNLDELKVDEMTEDKLKEFNELREFDLPVTKKHIKLKYVTPKLLDIVNVAVLEDKKRNPGLDTGLVQNIKAVIDTIDGEYVGDVALEQFCKNMPMKDANILVNRLSKLNTLIGIIPTLKVTCSNCKEEFDVSFRFNSEFFGPAVD